MRDFNLRSDLTRTVINGFALPLGIGPGRIAAPVQGYTVSYTPGEEDDPDTYAFHVVISHERLPALIDQAFQLLPPVVFPIVEIGSRDAYRAVDVYLGEEPISLREFRDTWRRYEHILIEDITLGAGANSEEPFIEVFLDEWKGLSIHVPLSLRDEVEAMLHEFGLEEVAHTWPPDVEENESELHIRHVIDAPEEAAPELLDELLLHLRHEWRLELNIDPDSNVDDKGRRLGMTLWQAVLIVESEKDQQVAYASVWVTAGSLTQAEDLIAQAMEAYPQWRIAEIFTLDRVAFDERPDELSNLAPRRNEAGVHAVIIEPWPQAEPESMPPPTS